MPNVFSCDPKWFEQLSADQNSVVVVAWQSGDESCNKWVEELSKLETEGIPVFVVDKDSCPEIAKKVAAKEAGEAVVYSKGKETGRVSPKEAEGIARLRKLVSPE